MNACARDPVAFINDWVWTYDPRNVARNLPATIPFDLFPKQAEFIKWIHEHNREGRPGICEKSRDAGMSWMLAAYFVHQWLFVDGFAGGMGSAKEDKVDKIGSPQTLFAKLRGVLYSLPSWMHPPGFDRRQHDSYLKLINPANGATIVGEGGDNMGRSGRFTMYFGDEWAFVPRAKLPKRAILEAARCFIRGSTPNGPAGDFAEDRFAGAIDVFTIHWRDDPRKDDAWYANKRDVEYATDPAGLAQEIDIDYFASVEGIFFPAEYVRSAIDAHKKMGWKLEGPRTTGLDIADGGANLNVCVSRVGPIITDIQRWAGDNFTDTTNRAIEAAEANGSEILYYDAEGVGSGVTSKLENRDDLPFDVVPIYGGHGATSTLLGTKPAKDLVLNLRAEIHWSLYLRLYKTHQVVTGKGSYPPGECISIPDDRNLVMHITTPKRQATESGKIKVESKKQMATRGVASPDDLDGTVYAFAHIRPEIAGGAVAVTKSTGGGRSPLVVSR